MQLIIYVVYINQVRIKLTNSLQFCCELILLPTFSIALLNIGFGIDASN